MTQSLSNSTPPPNWERADEQSAATFGRITRMLMRSPHYENHTLADLNWLLLAPLTLKQFSLLRSRSTANPVKPTVLSSVALWARVSDKIDARLMSNLSAPIKLSPDEWCSGSNVWIVDILGDPAANQETLKRLRTVVFPGQTVKMRVLGRDKRPLIKLLNSSDEVAISTIVESLNDPARFKLH